MWNARTRRRERWARRRDAPTGRASRRGGPRHPSGVVVERSASDRATRRDRYGSSTAFTPRVRHITGLRTNDSVGDTDRTPFAFEAFDPLSAERNRNRNARAQTNRECRTLRTHIARRKVHRHSLRASALFQFAHVGLVRRRAANFQPRELCARRPVDVFAHEKRHRAHVLERARGVDIDESILIEILR